MEILNNILLFIETYLSLSIFTTILNINLDKKQRIIYIISISTISIISNALIITPISFIISYIT